MMVWQKPNLLQARSLIQPEHDIHVLHRLSGCALDQIVYRRHDHHRVAFLRHSNGNLAPVGTLDGAGLWKNTRRQHVDERLVFVPLLVQCL